MLNDDCLNVRLSDYLERRRNQPLETATEEAEAELVSPRKMPRLRPNAGGGARLGSRKSELRQAERRFVC
jgi:hypothetical protein